MENKTFFDTSNGVRKHFLKLNVADIGAKFEQGISKKKIIDTRQANNFEKIIVRVGNGPPSPSLF